MSLSLCLTGGRCGYHRHGNNWKMSKNPSNCDNQQADFYPSSGWRAHCVWGSNLATKTLCPHQMHRGYQEGNLVQVPLSERDTQTLDTTSACRVTTQFAETDFHWWPCDPTWRCLYLLSGNAQTRQTFVSFPQEINRHQPASFSHRALHWTGSIIMTSSALESLDSMDDQS